MHLSPKDTGRCLEAEGGPGEARTRCQSQGSHHAPGTGFPAGLINPKERGQIHFAEVVQSGHMTCPRAGSESARV